ncbi:MAG: hypothetical protein CVV05_02775 [Gammaproteobacteria bacterium HGW-Gammaproteobacteria-1]|nr:MAG: hypothetical protein CVV05_02775 [Gammaproteobacteria bacterium HGW-Gammaproteobacteria-1]
MIAHLTVGVDEIGIESFPGDIDHHRAQLAPDHRMGRVIEGAVVQVGGGADHRVDRTGMGHAPRRLDVGGGVAAAAVHDHLRP